jgi:chromosome segregation ATPase
MTEKHVGFTIHEETWQSAMDRLEWGEMSERLRDTVIEIAYGADISERQKVQRRLDEIRGKRDETQMKIDNLQGDLQKQNAQIAELERTLATLQDVLGEYSGALQVIEDVLDQGARVDIGHRQVQRAAQMRGIEPAEVIADLKERNPDYPEKAFRWPEDGELVNWREDENRQ